MTESQGQRQRPGLDLQAQRRGPDLQGQGQGFKISP